MTDTTPASDDNAKRYFICTAEHPWRQGERTPVRHSGAHEVGEQEDGWPGGDIVTYECSHCGKRWKSELPQ